LLLFFLFEQFSNLIGSQASPKWNNVEPVKSLEDNHYTEGEIMGDHRCENCGKMFYTRYVQRKGNCFCQECSAKMGAAKKEKEYREAKEYWEARKK
jgi:formylmethanofuran dehydrogenase subunit E